MCVVQAIVDVVVMVCNIGYSRGGSDSVCSIGCSKLSGDVWTIDCSRGNSGDGSVNVLYVVVDEMVMVYG